MLITSCDYKNGIIEHNAESQYGIEDSALSKEAASIKNDNYSERIIINDVELKSIFLISTGGISEFNIEYPYLSDYSDSLTSRINKQIYETAVPNDIFQFKDYTEDVHISYEVKYTDNRILSVHFSGYASARGSYADFEKAVTIDLNSGNILSLSDFFTISELQTIVNNLIESDKCTIIDDLLNDPTSKKHLKLYLEDLLKEENRILSDTNNFYIKENKICLIGDCLPSMRQRLIAEIDIGKTLLPKRSNEQANK